MSTYKQLTQEQRSCIYQLNKIDSNQSEIGVENGVNKSTVSHELKSNAGGRGLSTQQARHKVLNRRLLAADSTYTDLRLKRN